MGIVIHHPRFTGRVSAGPWVTKQELASELGVSTRTVDRWVEYGMPRGTAWRYVGSRRRYAVHAVLDWLDVGVRPYLTG